MGWIEAGGTGTFRIKLSQRCESFKDLEMVDAKALCEDYVRRLASVEISVC